jgi:hypothetical protein
MTTTAEKVKTRGHWVVRVHPETYHANGPQKLADLEKAVRHSAVSLRGWDFPHYDPEARQTRSADYVEQSLDWEDHVELWRAYKSGQFVSVSGLRDDWRDQSGLRPATTGWKSGATLSIEDVVFRFVEIYEFAARWSRALSTKGALVIEWTLRGLENRTLQMGPRRLGFTYAQTCKVPEWSDCGSYQSTALLAQSRELSIPPAISLFELFGWDVSAEVVRGIQGDLRG